MAVRWRGQAMNGVHDMGGMHGFGPVERDEAAFHGKWEKRVHALFIMAFSRGIGPRNVDAGRHTIERIEPAAFLRSSYFERWLAALETRLVEHGVLDPADIEALAGRYEQDPDAMSPTRPAPRFAPGDRVVTRNIHPPGHTRLPRYARGKPGLIERVHGIHTFPDTNAHGLGSQPRPLYSVRFEAEELWGAAADGHGSCCPTCGLAVAA